MYIKSIDDDWESKYLKQRLRLIVGIEEYVNKYGELIDSINGSNESLLDAHMLQLKSVFKSDSAYYKYDYNDYRIGVVNVLNLQTVPKNCKK